MFLVLVLLVCFYPSMISKCIDVIALLEIIVAHKVQGLQKAIAGRNLGIALDALLASIELLTGTAQVSAMAVAGAVTAGAASCQATATDNANRLNLQPIHSRISFHAILLSISPTIHLHLLCSLSISINFISHRHHHPHFHYHQAWSSLIGNLSTACLASSATTLYWCELLFLAKAIHKSEQLNDTKENDGTIITHLMPRFKLRFHLLLTRTTKNSFIKLLRHFHSLVTPFQGSFFTPFARSFLYYAVV